MSWQATGWAIRTKTGNKGLKAVLMALAAEASAKGVVFARKDTIAEVVECNEKTIRRNVLDLRDLGLLRVFERNTAEARRASDVIVLMMPEQWSQRTECPAACEDHFGGHMVTEKISEAQGKVFQQQSFEAVSSECPQALEASGHSGPQEGPKCPEAPKSGETDKSLADNAESENSVEKPADIDVRQEGYTVNYTGRARATPGGDPDGPPGAAAPPEPDQSEPPDQTEPDQSDAERTLAAEWRETIRPAVEAALPRVPDFVVAGTLADVFVTGVGEGEWQEQHADGQPIAGVAPKPAVFVDLAVPDLTAVSRINQSWRLAVFRAAGYVLRAAVDKRAWARREARKDREKSEREAAAAAAKPKARRAS
jgi:hypothetical protein